MLPRATFHVQSDHFQSFKQDVKHGVRRASGRLGDRAGAVARSSVRGRRTGKMAQLEGGSIATDGGAFVIVKANPAAWWTHFHEGGTSRGIPAQGFMQKGLDAAADAALPTIAGEIH